MGPGSGPSGILAILVAVVDKSASSAEEETLDKTVADLDLRNR